MIRDYAGLVRRTTRTLSSLADSGDSRDARMWAVVNDIWDALAPTGVSWVGFYLAGEAAASAVTETPAGHLILGPRRDKPACSPIGLHGACGRCFLSRRPLIVRDVRELGSNYIACDPRDRSEVVIPCFERDGACWGVLDLDSHEIGAFDEWDADGLEGLLRSVGLTHPQH